MRSYTWTVSVTESQPRRDVTGGLLPTRYAHLVGSLPGLEARTAMTTALDIVGPYLRSLPDGETGPRSNWVGSSIEGLREHPDLALRKKRLRRDGSGQLQVRKGHRLYGASLDFGHVSATRQSYPIFKELTENRDDLVFQQGVPGDFDMAALTLGPPAAVRHRRPFTEATLAEIRGVREIAGPSALFQIEVPLELVLLAKAPRPARPLLARLLARNVTRLAAAAAAGTRFAVHLCVGDQDHRALATPSDVLPLVLLANDIIAHWPPVNPLVLVHAPFAAADHPASTAPAFLAPLRHLRLPAGVAFAAGFAHEDQSLRDQVQIRDRAEGLLQREIVVAAACGLGRRSETDGVAILQRMAELCIA